MVCKSSIKFKVKQTNIHLVNGGNNCLNIAFGSIYSRKELYDRVDKAQVSHMVII